MINWNKYRRPDGSIDLLHVWRNHVGGTSADNELAQTYFEFIESLQPINSRQAAAVAIANWRSFK